MKVTIYYCVPCRYRGRAETLARKIEASLGLDVDIVKGTWAQFDVFVDGTRVASKLNDAGLVGTALGVGEFPDDDETVAAIRALQAKDKT